MRITTSRTLIALVAIALVLGSAPSAHASTHLHLARKRRHRLAHRVARAHRLERRLELDLRLGISETTGLLVRGNQLSAGSITRWREIRGEFHRLRAAQIHRLRKLERSFRNRIHKLLATRRAVAAWIARYGVFQTCPVRGYHVVDDNFGVIVRIPHVPVHVHEGDDIIAYFGTPVVAPFAGVAVAAPNDLGGLAVKVYGARGYAYSAHLSSYGTLGSVHAGTVIGYVGATGDAGGPHDHFEWHPGGGLAVDPFPYLMAVC